MKQLVEFIVKRLADIPEAASVAESEQAGGVSLHLTVAEDDKGKIIGKQGKVIKAIRNVANFAAAKAGKNVRVDID